MSVLVYAVSTSAMVSDYLQRGLSANAGMGLTVVPSMSDLITDYRECPPTVLIIDFLLRGQRIDRDLVRLRGFPHYKKVPVIVTYGPSFESEASAMAQIDPNIVATLQKPFTVNRLLQVILPVSLGMPPSLGVTASAPQNSPASDAQIVPGYEAINQLPGVQAQFRWSSDGKILAASNEDASRLSNTFARCLRSCYDLSENSQWGDILEIQLFSSTSSAFLCSWQIPERSDFQTIGIVCGPMASPEELRDQVLKLLPG